MKRHLLLIALSATTLLLASGFAQNQAPGAEEQKVVALAQEVEAQEAQIAANQAKIDSKLVEVAEAIRVARIFASRSGQ